MGFQGSLPNPQALFRRSSARPSFPADSLAGNG